MPTMLPNTNWTKEVTRTGAMAAEEARFKLVEEEVKLGKFLAHLKLEQDLEEAHKLPPQQREQKKREAGAEFAREGVRLQKVKTDNEALSRKNKDLIGKKFDRMPGDIGSKVRIDGRTGRSYSLDASRPHVPPALPVAMLKGGMHVRIPNGQWVPGHQVSPGVYSIKIGNGYRTVAYRNGNWIRIR